MLHVAVRTDLPLGSQFAQAIHAATKFGILYDLGEDMPVAVVAVDDEIDLLGLLLVADPADEIVSFAEPDLDDALTAVACIVKSDSLRRAVARLPLIGEGG